MFVDKDRERALAEAREITGNYVNLVSHLLPREFIAQLNPGDPTKIFIDRMMAMPDDLDERAIVGTPQDCRRRLAELREEFGIEHIAFYFHAGARDVGRARQGLELFAKEVMPEFHP
jgi:alkanesulfonate monooxygenase SsuD/methylene tetrahydromethanopterin reductase-like flavin-dependent oxidoreductase (luciferase family)